LFKKCLANDVPLKSRDSVKDQSKDPIDASPSIDFSELKFGEQIGKG